MKNLQSPEDTVFSTTRLMYLTSFILWGFALFHISSIPGGFTTQAPVCMLSTMTIFGLTTLAIRRFDKRGE